METKTDFQRAEDLADLHWRWLEELLKKVYKDAFVHGYKHGREDDEYYLEKKDGIPGNRPQ